MLATDASTFSHWLVVVTTEQGFPYWRAPVGTADFGHTKSGSHPTLRWREMDSNLRFRVRKIWVSDWSSTDQPLV
jgi:hypothetical protein